MVKHVCLFKLVGGFPCQMMIRLISLCFVTVTDLAHIRQQNKTIQFTGTIHISPKDSAVRVVNGKKITVRQ